MPPIRPCVLPPPSSAFLRLLHALHPHLLVHLLVAAGGAPEQGGGGQLLIGLGEAMRTLRTFPVPVSVSVSQSILGQVKMKYRFQISVFFPGLRVKTQGVLT